MSLITRISNLWRRPEKWGKSWFYPISSKGMLPLSHVDSFLSIPELNAVISLKARAFSNGNLKIVDKNGVELPNHSYNPLLQNFNWFQPQNEFMRQTKLFHEIFGNEFLFTLKPVGVTKVKSLFTLPPNLVECKYKDSQPFFLFSEDPEIEYYVTAGSKKIPLDKDDIIHMNSDRVSIDSVTDQNLLLGESKLKNLEPVINNLRVAYESRGVILRNRGAAGILSNDGKDALGTHIPLEDEERKNVHDAYNQYGTLSDQKRVLITNLPLKWQPMEINPKNLGIWEETREDFNKILDAFGVPQDLFSRDKGATYENQNQARRGLYENTTVPEANEWVTGLNQSLMQDDNAKIIIDYSHLPIFQEDLKVKSEAISTTVNYLSRLLQDEAISREEYRAELFKIGIGNGEKGKVGKPKQNSNGYHLHELLAQ